MLHSSDPVRTKSSPHEPHRPGLQHAGRALVDVREAEQDGRDDQAAASQSATAMIVNPHCCAMTPRTSAGARARRAESVC